MTSVEYLDLEDLLGLVRALGAGPVRDAGLLDAACARPRFAVFGEDAYPTLEEKAAALLQSLVRNRALVDGNKRLGWLATAVFLDLNGHPPSLPDDEAFALVMSVAEGTLDVEEIAGRLERRRQATVSSGDDGLPLVTLDDIGTVSDADATDAIHAQRDER